MVFPSPSIKSLETMCPACIAAAALLAAGAGVTTGIVAACVNKSKKAIAASGLGPFQKRREK